MPASDKPDLGESRAGRFELIRLPHWSFAEMAQAFGWDLERYVYFGGYPGAAVLVEGEFCWKRYVLDAIIEPTLSRDVLQLARIDKPALPRRLFVPGGAYSGQILAYQKMIGLDKFAGDMARSRAGSPKLQVLNTALLAVQATAGYTAARRDGEQWRRLVESAVGAHLRNTAPPGMTNSYWRERNHEVDFVIEYGGKVTGVEVKSGVGRGALAGLERFNRSFKAQPGLVVGTGGVPLAQFLERPALAWFGA